MKSSTNLNRVRRLVLLGAVVAAGAFAATAGAGGRPPDIQDIAGQNLVTIVSRPPDVRDVASRASVSVPDVFERYAAAHLFGSGLSQYDTAVGRPPDVKDSAASVNALSTSSSTLVSRPPDVVDRALARQIGSAGQSHGFDWNDWGIGMGTGMGLALLLGITFLMSRQLRHRVQPV